MAMFWLKFDIKFVSNRETLNFPVQIKRKTYNFKPLPSKVYLNNRSPVDSFYFGVKDLSCIITKYTVKL